MSIAEKLTTIAENEQKVYEAGQKSEWDRFWDDYQQNGNRTDYMHAFSYYWSVDTCKPKYDMKPTDMQYMFAYNFRGIVDDPSKAITMREFEERSGITIDISNATKMQCAFGSSFFSEIKDLDVSHVTGTYGIYDLFYGGYAYPNCRVLKRVEGITFSENNVIPASMFGYCEQLEYVGFKGVITGTLNLSTCPKLNVESMKMAINCLKNYSGTDKAFAYQIKFHDNCWAALEADSTAPDGGTWKDYVQYTLGWNV